MSICKDMIGALLACLTIQGGFYLYCLETLAK